MQVGGVAVGVRRGRVYRVRQSSVEHGVRDGRGQIANDGVLLFGCRLLGILRRGRACLHLLLVLTFPLTPYAVSSHHWLHDVFIHRGDKRLSACRTANDVDEMRKVLKEYLEYGTFSTDGFRNSSNAGVVLLGNIPSDEMKDNCNLFQYISNLFQEAAIFDRFHGMIEGNKIPRMHDNLKVNGLALNQEYFTSILHLLRDDNSFTGIFDEYVEIPEKADTRHTTAIRRLFTAWVKLLFPYIRLVRVDLNLLRKVLDIAVNMRRAVWSQLVMMDAGFADKPVGEYRIKRDSS